MDLEHVHRVAAQQPQVLPELHVHRLDGTEVARLPEIPDLGRQEMVLTPLRKGLAHDCLGCPHAVHDRRVEIPDACVEGAADSLDRAVESLKPDKAATHADAGAVDASP